MTTTWLLLLCALGLAISLPQRRQAGWWPSDVTLPSNLPDTATTRTTSTTPGVPTPTPTATGAPASSQAPCDCPAPPQYNPVCGSDNQTYTNPQKLECANTCGQRVTILYLGTCQLRRK